MKRLSPTPGLSHAESMVRHAMRVLWARHGIAISRAEYFELCVAVFLGDVPLITRDDRGNPVHRIKVRGVQVFAVWSVMQARIVTFLPCRQWIGRRWDGRKFVDRVPA